MELTKEQLADIRAEAVNHKLQCCSQWTHIVACATHRLYPVDKPRASERKILATQQAVLWYLAQDGYLKVIPKAIYATALVPNY